MGPASRGDAAHRLVADSGAEWEAGAQGLAPASARRTELWDPKKNQELPYSISPTKNL